MRNSSALLQIIISHFPQRAFLLCILLQIISQLFQRSSMPTLNIFFRIPKRPYLLPVSICRIFHHRFIQSFRTTGISFSHKSFKHHGMRLCLTLSGIKSLILLRFPRIIQFETDPFRSRCQTAHLSQPFPCVHLIFPPA